MMIVNIGGTDHETIGDVSFTLNAEDALDQCAFAIAPYSYYNNGKYAGTKWEPIRFSDGDVMREFSLYQYAYYASLERTTIQGVEPTRILDELSMKGFALSPITSGGTAKLNAWMTFVELVRKLNQRLTAMGSSYSLAITSSLTEGSNPFSKEPGEVIADGVRTFREIIDYWLSSFDLAIRATSIADGVITLALDDPNAITGNDIDITGRRLTATAIGQQMVDSIVTDARNVISDDEMDDCWQGVISESNPFSTESAIIPVTHPIYRLSGLKVTLDPANVMIYGHASCNGGVLAWHHTLSELGMTDRLTLDISDRVVDKRVFETMTDEEQNETLYYSQGQPRIEHVLTSFRESLSVMTDTVIEKAIYSKNLNFGLTDPYYPNTASALAWWGSLDDNTRTFIRGGLLQLEPSYSLDYDKWPDIGIGLGSVCFSYLLGYKFWRDLRFKATYAAIDSIIGRTGSAGTSALDNVSSPSMLGSALFAHEGSMLQRMGNEEITLDLTDTAVSIGDRLKVLKGKRLGLRIYDNYLVDTVTASLGGHVKRHVHATMGYNALNERVALNKELRLYRIPTTGYVTCDIELPLTAESPKGLIVGRVIGGGSQGAVYSRVYLPLTRKGEAYLASTIDNCGARRYLITPGEANEGIFSHYVTNVVPYCASDGTLYGNTLMISVVSEGEKTESSYPLSDLTDYNVIQTIPLIYDKDAYEQLNFVLRR